MGPISIGGGGGAEVCCPNISRITHILKMSDSLINISFPKIAGKQGKRHISFLILFEGNVYGQIHVLLTTKTIFPLGYTFCRLTQD